MGKIKFPRAEYDECLSGEQADRAFVFLGLPESICGIACKPLTPRLAEYLRLAKSPFIIGGMVGAAEIAQFIWVVSTGFVATKEARNEFLKAHLNLDVRKARTEIDEYLDRTYLNSREGGDVCPKISACASYAHALAGDPYRMSWREVMDTPLGVIFQLMTAVDIIEGRGAINKRSDRFYGDYADALQKQSDKARKRKAKTKKEVVK